MAEADPTRVAELRRELGCHPITAQLLVNRGITSPGQAKVFLSPSLSGLRLPSGMRDIDSAADRLCRAVLRRETILVFGDYDADGVTAAALLSGFLSDCGANVRVYLPHRLREGYGIKADQIRRLTRKGGIRLIVTVDCGSASHEALQEAVSAGVEVIVTDHHQVSGALPPAEAVVNPCRPDCASDLEHLAGVGVCFYVVIALRRKLRDAGFWSTRPEPNLRDYCDLVALGTVADMVPLRDENRILVSAGLSVINRAPRPGIAALLASAGVEARHVDASSLAYGIAPRINAAGRMAHAVAAFRLLTAKDEVAAGRLAGLLERLNRRRRQIEAQMMAEANEMIHRRPELGGRRAIVLSRPDWPEGVLGIVASRLVRQLNRPVAMISIRNGKGKGSARSVIGIDLHRALLDTKDCLERFGGHAMAAGMTVSAEQIAAFEDRFEAAVRHQADSDSFDRSLRIDAEMPLSEITDPLMAEIERIGPFGEGNPEPLLMARAVEIVSSSPAGADHLRMTLRQAGNRSGPALEAIRFGAGSRPPESPVRKMAFRLRWNRWRGRRKLQMVVVAAEDDLRIFLAKQTR